MALAVTSFAAEEEPVFDLTQQSNFQQCTQTSLKYDHEDYPAWSFSSYSNYPSMYNYNITAGYYDDYLTTPALQLEPGKMYVVYLRPSAYMSYGADSNLDVLVGQGSDPASYTTLRSFLKLPYASYSEPATLHEVTFIVETAGEYHVSFRGYSNSLYLKDTKIMSRGESGVPKAPTDFTAVPDPDGQLKVDISFTMPTATVTGQPLETPAYNLYRGVQKVKSAISAAPGERVTFTDVRGEESTLTYSVEALNGEEVSEKLTITTFVGPETPAPPADVAIGVAEGKFVVSWTAPAEGVHGAMLDPSRLSYEVTRIVDDNPTVVAENLKACSYADEVTPDGLQFLKYAVRAKYGPQAKTSDSVESSILRIGTVTLPFADSFAGAQISPMWDNEVVYCKITNPGSNYYWQAKDKDTTSKYSECEPFDNDGGMLIYNSYMVQADNSARLATPPIAFEAGQNPALVFAMYHIAQNNRPDVMRVQISCDYGEWTDIPEAEFTPVMEGLSGWTLHSVPLADAIPAGTESYRVGLFALSGYGENLVIDAVKIFNVVSKDLQLLALSAPEEIVAGNEIEVILTVSNNSDIAVAADAYTLALSADGYPGELQLPETEAIPGMGQAVYNVRIPVNSIHITDGNIIRFSASVTLAGDQVPGNDALTGVTTTVEYSRGTPATNLTGKYLDDNDNCVTLSWNPAKDLSYEPVDIRESFENEEWADGYTGPFNGWISIDLDGKGGSNWYSASGSTFKLCKKPGTPGVNGGRDGDNCLGVTVLAKVEQDDWLISPLLNCNEDSEMELKFLFGCKESSSYGNNYYIALTYTTDEEIDMLNPRNNFTQELERLSSTSSTDRLCPQDNKFHEMAFEARIPGRAKHVALHFMSKGSYDIAMWVDNIRLTEVNDKPLLGYRLYGENEGCCISGDELISPDVDTFTLPNSAPYAGSPTRYAFLTAVYPDGEAVPTESIDLNNLVSGVESVGVDTDENPLPEPAEYYNLQGIKVAGDRLNPGIYIRRTANRTAKIFVK